MQMYQSGEEHKKFPIVFAVWQSEKELETVVTLQKLDFSPKLIKKVFGNW